MGLSKPVLTSDTPFDLKPFDVWTFSLSNQRVQWFWLYGRYWFRTSDLFRVKEARYHCANRPWAS